MESKTVFKDLIERTVAGDFNYVFNYLSSLQKPLEENQAIKLIIACCNACNNNLSTPDKLKDEDLVALVKCLLKFIKTHLKEQCDSYLQSVFFIVKLLIEKKSFQSILQLEELLMPGFMSSVFSEKQSVIYLNICKIIYNAIVRISNAKEKMFRVYVIKLCFLLCLMYKKSHNVSKLMDSVHNSIISLANLNVDTEELLKFYTFYLDLLNGKDLSIYQLLIDNFSCLYAHLLKMEKFETAQSCYMCTVRKIKQIFKNSEYLLLSEIFEIVHWMNPVCTNNSSEVPTKAHNSLRNYYKQYKSLTNLRSICDVISSVLIVTLQYYKTVDNKKWLEKPIEVQLKLFNFLFDVSHILSKTPSECGCKTCPTKTNILEAVRILDSVLGLGGLFIAKNPSTPRNYKTDIFRYLEKYTDHIYTLKKNKCSKWEFFWYNCGVRIYSIGLSLEEQKDFDMCTVFMRKFADSVLYLEGTEPRVIGKNYLQSAMGIIAECWLEIKQYEKALLIIAWAMTWGNGKDLINRWIKTKVACRDNTIIENEELQELTLISVCQKLKSELSTYFPNCEFAIDQRKQVELLVHELNGYKMKWKSKVPMMAAYRHLSQVADSTTLAKVFIEIWGDCDLKVHDDIPILLKTTIKKLEVDTVKDRSLKVKFYLSYLYFLQHKYRVKDTIIKHCDEMERTMIMTKVVPETGVDPPDPNDECDFVSSYDCLKLSRYLGMIKELNKSLDMITDLFSEIVESLPEKSNLYKLLIKIGHEYNLHSHTAKSLQAFELALKLSEFENEKINFFQAGTYILELVDVSKPLVKSLVKKLDEIAVSLYEQKSSLPDVMMYLLSKAEAFFYADFNTCYKAFQRASILWEICEETSILKARYYLLHHKLIMLPCKLNVEGHEEYSLVRIHQAHNYAIKHYTESLSDSAYEMTIFFDISENLVKMYHDMRLPREVRCYGKETLLLAQKMVLPLRTTSLLFYLANADVNSSRLDGCKEKINGISDILCLSRGKNFTKNHSPEEKDSFDQIMENLNAEFTEIVLDVPARHYRVPSSGSPIFEVETFHYPSFLRHGEGCECFYCTWKEYQEFVLKKTYLHALFYEYDGKVSLARDFFCGSVKIYESLKSKGRSYSEKIAKKMSEDLVPCLGDKFSLIYSTILLDYGNLLLRAGKTKEADSLNQKIFEKLDLIKKQSVHLYNEVLAQQLNILVLNIPQKKEVYSQLQPCVVNPALLVKTPENKQSKVVVSPICSPGYVEKVKIIPKLLKFNLSNEEENVEAARKPAKVNVPNFLQMPMTPAPSNSKIKIYTNTKSAKKKKVLEEVKTENNTRESDFLIPASPEAYTPCTGKVDAHLANRTKLLTEKLRNSSRKSRKVPSVVVTDENNLEEGCSKEGGAQTRRLKNVRQNLLKELESTENGEQRGAIRRSARNKK